MRIRTDVPKRGPKVRVLMRLFQIMSLSFIGAFGCGVLFVVALSWTLPPTDAAYHQSPAKILWDPFVLGGILVVASFSALLIGPFAYYCLRGRRVLHCSLLSFAIVGVEVLLTAPTGTPFGILGAYVVLTFSLLYCRSSSHPWFVDQQEGYQVPVAPARTNPGDTT